jgi:hypothetical protein
LYLGSLDSSWLVDDVGALRDMSFSDIRGIITATVSALNIVVIVRTGRRREI